MGERTMMAGRVAAAGLLAAVVAGCAAADGSGAGRSAAAVPVASADPPQDWQQVSSLGLEVAAPGAWPINPWPCDPAPPAQVLRGQGIIPLCGQVRGSAASVEIQPLVDEGVPAPPSPAAAPAVRQLTLAGVPASSSTVRLADGRTHITLTVPARRVQMVVVSPDAAIAQRVLASARLVDVDSFGCATSQPPDPSWSRRRPGPKVSLRAAAAPTALAVCAYQDLRRSPDGTPPARGTGVLVASTVLTGAELASAVASIDGAAAGPSPDARAGSCLPGTPEDAPLWLHARYADGRSTPVRVRYSACTDRWTATPDGMSQVTAAQLEALLKPVHTGYGFPGDLPAG